MRLFIFIVSTFAMLAGSEILFKHCLGPADIGNFGSKGIFPNVCLENHNFISESHTWSFWKSIVKNTNFTSCVFADRPSIGQNYLGTTWINVIFKDTVFKSFDTSSDKIKFERTSFQDVLFDSCTFDSSANIVFSNFAFSNVEFRNCTFGSSFKAELGSIQMLLFSGCSFGSMSGSADKEEGNMLFSQVTGSRVNIENSTSSAELRIQQSSFSAFEMVDTEWTKLACHEVTINNKEPEMKSELNQTYIIRVSFADGIYCDHTTFRTLELHDISYGNTVDLSESDVERLAVFNASSISEDKSPLFDISGAEIHGDRIKNIETDATFEDTVFTDTIILDDFSIAKTTFTLNGTVFPMEKVNGECCTESCQLRHCLCDVSVEPIFCPVGTRSVNINIPGACFPAMASVSVVDEVGRVAKSYMKDVQHGDRVVYAGEGMASDVFFFGHRTRRAGAYVVLTSHTAETGHKYRLAISADHLLPVAGRGLVAAGRVVVGNKLFTENGDEAVVRNIESRILEGMYAPTTLTGELVVDGIRVSCYTDIVPVWLAHAGLSGVRAAWKAGRWGRWVVERVDFLHERSYAAGIRRLVGSLMGMESEWVRLTW